MRIVRDRGKRLSLGKLMHFLCPAGYFTRANIVVRARVEKQRSRRPVTVTSYSGDGVGRVAFSCHFRV